MVLFSNRRPCLDPKRSLSLSSPIMTAAFSGSRNWIHVRLKNITMIWNTSCSFINNQKLKFQNKNIRTKYLVVETNNSRVKYILNTYENKQEVVSIFSVYV